MVRATKVVTPSKSRGRPPKVADPFENAPEEGISGKKRTREHARDNWQVPGYALIRLIREEQLARGHNTDEEIIDGLEISQSHWNATVNGSRQIKGLLTNPARVQWIATYIGKPPIVVRVLAEEIPVEDLVVNFNLDDRLRQTAKELRDDPLWATLAPNNIAKEWDVLPLKARMLIKALYDREKDRVFTWSLEEAANRDLSGQKEADPSGKGRSSKSKGPVSLL